MRSTDFALQIGGMRVTIIRRPEGAIVGMRLSSFHVGQTYNLRPEVARALVLEGFGFEERRWSDRRNARRLEAPGRRRRD
jgi:hypothetical protein